jgi:hypothetical protein
MKAEDKLEMANRHQQLATKCNQLGDTEHDKV